MELAIAEARKGVGKTTPNPTVGAVLVKGSKVLSTGWHRAAGEDHAEVAALRLVEFDARGCDLYTTLEPCNHHGRTGPCTQQIIDAGVRRVFVGAIDPNPKVAGGGVKRLEAAGIEVKTGILEAECTALNEAYNFAIVNRRAFSVLKIAMSLDGKVATRTGQSQWITSEEARADGRELRGVHDAILVGRGTVDADDPRLTARETGVRDPVRVVLDSRLRVSPRSKLVKSAPDVRTILVCTDAASKAARRRFEGLGCEILECPATKDSGGVSPKALMKQLFRLGLNSVLVEGGGGVHGSFVDAGVADKLIVYVAPMIIGGAEARTPVAGLGAARLARALRLHRVTHTMVGDDLKIVGYRE